MKPEVWSRFVENGTVPESTLHSIAYKIRTGTPVSKQELTIYSHYSSQIEELLKSQGPDGRNGPTPNKK